MATVKKSLLFTLHRAIIHQWHPQFSTLLPYSDGRWRSVGSVVSGWTFVANAQSCYPCPPEKFQPKPEPDP